MTSIALHPCRQLHADDVDREMVTSTAYDVDSQILVTLSIATPDVPTQFKHTLPGLEATAVQLYIPGLQLQQ